MSNLSLTRNIVSFSLQIRPNRNIISIAVNKSRLPVAVIQRKRESIISLEQVKTYDIGYNNRNSISAKSGFHDFAF